VDLDYPADIRRRIDRKWRARAARAAVAARARRAPARHDPATCPLCRERAAVASTERKGGLLRRHWLCAPCGFVWTTTARLAG